MRLLAFLASVVPIACAVPSGQASDPFGEHHIQIEFEECDSDAALDYVDRVFSAIEPIWLDILKPPTEARVVLVIRIDENGALTDATTRRSSSSQAAEAAITATRRAAPFPRPPGGEACIGANTPIEVLLYARFLEK